jgi:signal transduction histidine kinase
MAHRRTTALAVAVIERVALAAAIGGAFVASGAVVAAVHGPTPSPALSVLAAAMVAFAAAPTRRFVRRLVHRIVYGGPASPVELVRQLSMRVARGRDPVELLGEVAGLIQTGTGADSVVIWLRLNRGWVAAAGSPGPLPAGSDGPGVSSASAEPDRLVPIRHDGDELGAMAIEGASPLTPHAERLISDLAQHAAEIMRTLYLRESLRRELDTARDRRRELVAARRNLVEVQDAERRRLERDIHDSCQQQATLIAGRVGLAGALATTDPASARAELQRAATDVARLASRLDRLTGAGPADLVTQGLAAALAVEFVGLPVAIAVQDARDRGYPTELDATLYFCAMEAVQNAVKHGDPQAIHIGLSDMDGRVTLTVRDDGSGLPPAVDGAGTGLRNLRERLEPWSGSVAVRSSARGTEVEIVACAQVPT